MTEKKENPSPSSESTDAPTDPTDSTPETPCPSLSLDATEEASKYKDSPLPSSETASKLQKDKPRKQFKVDVDLKISQWDLKSEEIPCLVGENLPSSNSDENYGSYDNATASNPSCQPVKNRKPWIKTVKGTLSFQKSKLDEATMEAWLADGSDDSLPNSNIDERNHPLLSPDDEFEEFQETPNTENQNNFGNKEGNIDLLTGDDYAKEDSNPCTQPILCNQINPDDHGSVEEEKPIFDDLQFDPIQKSVIETVEDLVLLTLKLSSTSDEQLSILSEKGNEKEAVEETTTKIFDADHYNCNTNCFNASCMYDHSCATDIGLKLLNRNVTHGFGLDDIHDNLPKCEDPVLDILSNNTELKEESQKEVDSLTLENLPTDTQIEKNFGNCDEIPMNPPSETIVEDRDETAPIQDQEVSKPSMAVGEDSGETLYLSEALAKHKKRVTFADELEKERLGMEPLKDEQKIGCGEVLEIQQKPDTSALPLMSEVNPNKDNEKEIISSGIAELVHKSRPGSMKEYVPSEADEDLRILKTQRKSPLMFDVQDKTADEEKVLEKPTGKISRLFKSMKKKIGKIL